MSSILFSFPKQAEFGKVIPKSKIYEHTKPSKSLKEKFVSELDHITWLFKLSPETLRLPARGGISEIQIFGLTLKKEEVSEQVLRCIDEAIPHLIFFELYYHDKVKIKASYKRPNELDSSKFVVDTYFESPWMPTDVRRIALPVALDLMGLYEQMLRSYMDIQARENEPLRLQIERINANKSLQKECLKMAKKLENEKQFNRKVELNSQLRDLNSKLESLLN
jgi:hypothetical protein